MRCPTTGEGTGEEAGPGPSGPISGRSASLGPVASGLEAGWPTPHGFGRAAGSCCGPGPPVGGPAPPGGSTRRNRRRCRRLLRSRRAKRSLSRSVNRRFSAIRASSFASHSWSRASNPAGSRLPFSSLQARASRKSPANSAPASSPAEAAPTPAGPAPPDGPKPGNSPLPTRPKTPAPGPPPPLHGTGAHRWWAGQNPQPGPLPPDPPPRLIGVHRHRVPKGLHQLLRQSLIGLAQARTPGYPEQLRHLPRDAQPMLQVRRQRPRPPPPPSPTTPAGDGAIAPASDIDDSSHPPSETA
jgi:hypothetical protein